MPRTETADWNYFDNTIINTQIQPHQLGKRLGFSIYDEERITPIPNYYGIVVVNKQTQRQMCDDGINGGYSLMRKAAEKLDLFVVTPKQQIDFQKAINYEHYAHHKFENNKNIRGKGFKSFELDNPEIKKLKKDPKNEKYLLTLTDRGVSIKEIAGYLQISPDGLLNFYYQLKR
jgi:hypothetical protein